MGLSFLILKSHLSAFFEKNSNCDRVCGAEWPSNWRSYILISFKG